MWFASGWWLYNRMDQQVKRCLDIKWCKSGEKTEILAKVHLKPDVNFKIEI